jgi:hypothetical protein
MKEGGVIVCVSQRYPREWAGPPSGSVSPLPLAMSPRCCFICGAAQSIVGVFIPGDDLELYCLPEPTSKDWSGWGKRIVMVSYGLCEEHPASTEVQQQLENELIAKFGNRYRH